ncbi:MAG: DUF1302 family protein [Candidatus Krumholzibacteriales bacterium]
MRFSLRGNKLSAAFLRLLFLAGLLVSGSVNMAFARGVSLNGYVRNYTGILMNEENEYSIIQNTLNLDLEHRKGKIAFKANPYLYHYSDSELEIDLREVYMDVYFDKVDLRIGKQQIIWGKAEGVFITDIISPKDLREFLLPDFEEIRIGVTAFKFDYYLGDHNLEAVWLPVFTPTLYPEEESIWRPQIDYPVPPRYDYSRREVEGSLKNSEFFAKYSAMTSAIDFEIMAGYAWDDDPTMHISRSVDPESREILSLTVTPEHHRLGIAGGSFSTTLGPVVFRGEGAWYSGKYFNTADAEVEKNYIHYLLGLDYSLWDIDLSGQFIQQAIMDYHPGIRNDEFNNTATLRARRDFMRETLTLELFSYIGLNNNDALIRPRIYYDMADGFEVLLGANLFVGDEGQFGQYSDNDMGYFKFKYSF